MKRLPFAALAAIFLFAACADSNPMGADTDVAPAYRSAELQPMAPGFLAVDGLPALNAKGKPNTDRQVVCHFPPSPNARPVAIPAGQKGAEVHLTHPGDGYVGEGFSDSAANVLYDENCEPLPPPPACPCWNDYETWSMLAAMPWSSPRTFRNITEVRIDYDLRTKARVNRKHLGGRCWYRAEGLHRVQNGIGDVTEMCAADIESMFTETHQ